MNTFKTWLDCARLARLCIKGPGREIYIDTYCKEVRSSKYGRPAFTYAHDKLGIDDYCRERFEETK